MGTTRWLTVTVTTEHRLRRRRRHTSSGPHLLTTPQRCTGGATSPCLPRTAAYGGHVRTQTWGAGQSATPSPERTGSARPQQAVPDSPESGQAVGLRQLEDTGGPARGSPGQVATSTWQTLPGLPYACSKGHISHDPLAQDPESPVPSRSWDFEGRIWHPQTAHSGDLGAVATRSTGGCDLRLGESPGSIPGVCVPPAAAHGPSYADPSASRRLADGSRQSDGAPGVDLLS